MEFQAKPADGQDDVKVKQIALRTNENIQTMIKDLFHSPPIYKASVTLSFKVIYHLLNMGFINIQSYEMCKSLLFKPGAKQE